VCKQSILLHLCGLRPSSFLQAKKGVMGKVEELFGGKKQMESDLEKPKPWILWWCRRGHVSILHFLPLTFCLHHGPGAVASGT